MIRGPIVYIVIAGVLFAGCLVFSLIRDKISGKSKKSDKDD